MADKFERFTERARKVFSLAQDEAMRLNHNYIGTEHLLLGLVREGDGIAARVLANLGVQLPRMREAVEATVGLGNTPQWVNPDITDGAKKVIEFSMEEARRLNNHYIGTEHLLLGLLREGEGVAAIVLEKTGVSLDKVRGQVLQVVSQSHSYQQSRPQVRKPAEPMTGPPMSMDELTQRFTEGARNAFALSLEEAARFNHNYIGTEHLLLGLVKESEGIAARVLANLGVQLPKVRSAVEFIIGRGDGLVVGDPGLTPRAKKVINLAMDEARRLDNHFIGTEHLLLGLVREGEGIAAGVLESLGVSLERVRQSVMQIVSSRSFYQSSKGQPPANLERLGIAPDIEGAQYRDACTYYTFKMLRGDFDRLVQLSERLNRSPDDLVIEAIWRVWFTKEGDAGETPPPPTPRPLAGEGSL